MKPHELSEIKSEQAKLIIKAKPSLIVRIGIIILMTLFSIIFVIISLIKINPQLTAEVVIIDSQQAYAMLPYKDIVFKVREVPIEVKVNNSNSGIKYIALLEKREAVISNSSIYWKVPLVATDISTGTHNYPATSDTKATASFPLVETSILRHIFRNLFDSSTINIAANPY